MSTSQMSSRSASPSSGEDNGSIRGSIDFGEIPSSDCSDSAGSVVPDSDESFHCRGLSCESFGSQNLSLESFQCQGVSPSDLLPHHDWRSLSSESFQCRGLSFLSSSDSSCESFQCRGLSWQDLSSHTRPDPPLPGPNALFYTHADGNPRRNRNFLGLKLNLTGISTFERQVLALDGCLESGNEAALLKPSDEVELLLESAAPSLPQSASPIDTTHPVIISTSVPMLGSSRLRELKLKRSRKTRLRGFKRTLKKFVKIL
ncbi:hypothetical protein PSTT_12767 [Puccinia striiformis]|uniref:Uncharacterized protein n=1 Tax=Puccinia striiformis TaxID=27350 RepID=A0A2S4UUR0_9BASI|nr:hypothetical protein PSTT_12767 [Puccinia striiformis]